MGSKGARAGAEGSGLQDVVEGLGLRDLGFRLPVPMPRSIPL